MAMTQIIQIFEYETIQIGQNGLNNTHFQSLVQFNEQHGNKYFTVGYNKITFSQYVGVLQVGNLIVEILPKADRQNNQEKWRGVLLHMLRKCGYLKLEHVSHALLRLHTHSLVDLFLYTFIAEVEYLTRTGLVKKYRRVSGSTAALKGRIVFPKQIPQQLIHKELFYTNYSYYSVDNIYNQILKKAIKVIENTARNPRLIGESKKLQLYFEDVKTIDVNRRTFQKLTYDRKTESYQKAIELAELIILNQSPGIRSGTYSVLSFLFDMNRLFEKYILFELKKAEHLFENVSVEGQLGKQFWKHRRIKPDIIITDGTNKNRSVIVDTKWKLLESNNPSDEDLQQMFTYNIHFGTTKSILLYPGSYDYVCNSTNYAQSKACPEYMHCCELYFISLLDDAGRIKKNLGQELLAGIMNK